MAAINPSRLRSEIEELAGILDDPSGFSRQVLSLLRFYADYTRRPGSATGVDDAPWVLHVPDPILRELQRALIRWVRERPQLAEALCTALWDPGYREMQLLAAGLLGHQSCMWVPDWAQNRAADSRDRPALAALASDGLAGWRTMHTGEYFGRAETWLQDKNTRLQTLALLSLQPLDLEGDWLPSVFDLLERCSWEPRAGSGKAMEALLQALAAFSGSETTGYMLQMLKEQPQKAQPFVPALQGILQDHQFTLLQQALSGE